MMINLDNIPTTPPKSVNKDLIKGETKKLKKEFAELQHIMAAQEKYSLLIVLQGLDAAGKDGTVKKVFSKIPAFGISISNFKVPSKKELAHDFLWRVHKETPEKGMVKVFNRSHYEDVLVTRALGFVSDEEAEKRFRIINNFEEIVQNNNTIILKFYLHISHEKQEERLRDRMQNPTKYYKHSDGDWAVRKQWNDYRQFYNECLSHTQETAPWHIIPVDKKWYRNYLICKTIVETLRELPLAYPPLETELV